MPQTVSLSKTEALLAARGSLGLILRPVTFVNRIGRVTEFGPSDTKGYDWIMRDGQMRWNDLRHDDLLKRCPLGAPGARVVGQETWGYVSKTINVGGQLVENGQIVFQVTNPNAAVDHPGWRSPVTLPWWKCRAIFVVQSIAVCRLLDLSEADAALAVEFETNDDGTVTYWGDGRIEGHGNALHALAQVWMVKYAKHGPNPWLWKVAVTGRQ